MNDRLKAMYFEVFKSPQGEEILKDLERQYNGNILKKKDGVIDPYAMAAAVGGREVVLHIKRMMENKNASA